MRNVLVVVFSIVGFFMPLAQANPPLCEGAGARSAKGIMKPASVAVEAEPTVFILTEPRKVRTFENFSVCDRKALGRSEMVICEHPPVMKWVQDASYE